MMTHGKRWLAGVLAGVALWAATSAALAHQRTRREGHRPGTDVLGSGAVPAEVRAIMGRACRDCHSAATDWPWYAGLPPVSWLVQSDVERGRKFLDLSRWDEYSPAQRIGYLAAMTSSTAQNRMPPQPYRWLHWPANLTEADRQEIRAWALTETRRQAVEMRRQRLARKR